ncbi:hypothetical protein [Pseudobacillus badius]|nr:hypothetical protein [Bacillus badius]
MKRSKGDKYRPIVTITKMKGETPSVLMVSGRRYVLDHKDTGSGGNKK